LVLGFREIRQETTLDAQGEAQQAGKQALGNSKKNSFNRFTQFKLLSEIYGSIGSNGSSAARVPDRAGCGRSS
jgi:hypothetical protein